MVGTNQYLNCWNYKLHVYAIGRTVCLKFDHEHCCESFRNTDIYTANSLVSEQYSTDIANNIQQWNNRFMVGSSQYSNSWNDKLHVYAFSRTVCLKFNHEHCCE